MCKRFICLFVILFSLPIFSQKDDWKLRKYENNIKILTRALPKKALDEYKAETIINNSIEAILDELLTAPSYNKSYQPGVSYYVDKVSNNQHTFYVYKALPWPIKNRDLITLLTVHRLSEHKIKLVLEGLPDALPKKDQTIRIKDLQGHWLLEEINGKTKVTQQLFVNPEGSLPPFIINLLLIKGPFKTFSHLRKTLDKTEAFVSKK
ncbi:START domain-containing protein [uncultured Winogradskyella sp.]|uniref:START domain-containing protein n=1 Tax=uncultured Winogradskyella sp. TaxID=395353 RepID=UPI00261F6A5C|nr:START domain-containing protein [uncultured Winogradskyella sp.]